MKCPVCPTSELLMTDRQGVEIDYCPKCRGVWLDRGELDKIIERATPVVAAQATPVSPELRYREPDHPSAYGKHGHGHDDHHGDKHGYGGPYKKKSLLKDIFDF